MRRMGWLSKRLIKVTSRRLAAIVSTSELVAILAVLYVSDQTTPWIVLTAFTVFIASILLSHRALNILECRGEYYDDQLWKANHPDDLEENATGTAPPPAPKVPASCDLVSPRTPRRRRRPRRHHHRHHPPRTQVECCGPGAAQTAPGLDNT